MTEISQFLNESRDDFRKINNLTNEIEKLNEYRTALISAAVTGKIDVRGYSNER